MKGEELEEFTKRISRLIELGTNVPVVIIIAMDEDGEVFTHAKGKGWQTVIRETVKVMNEMRNREN